LAEEIEIWRAKAEREAADQAEPSRLRDEAEAKERDNAAVEGQKAQYAAEEAQRKEKEAVEALKCRLEEEAAEAKRRREQEAAEVMARQLEEIERVKKLATEEAMAESQRIFREESAKFEAAIKADFSKKLAEETAKVEAAAKADTAKLLAEERVTVEAIAKAEAAKLFAEETEKYRSAIREEIAMLGGVTDRVLYHHQYLTAEQAHFERLRVEASLRAAREAADKHQQLIQENLERLYQEEAARKAAEKEAESQAAFKAVAQQEEADRLEALKAATRQQAAEETARRAIEAQAETLRVAEEVRKQAGFVFAQYPEIAQFEEEQKVGETQASNIESAEIQKEREIIREGIRKELGTTGSPEEMLKRLNAIKLTDIQERGCIPENHPKGRSLKLNLKNF